MSIHIYCHCYLYFNFTFQVSEVVLEEGQTFDFTVIMQLVIMLSVRPTEELKGFMCIVCQTFPLPPLLFYMQISF
jgi:hypothetical protein